MEEQQTPNPSQPAPQAAQPAPAAQPAQPAAVPAVAGAAAPATGKAVIAYDDFAKLDLRVARVVEVVPHPNADKLLCVTVDMGTERRQVIAGIRAWYTPETLVGKLVIVVANLQPRKMRGLESNGMMLAAGSGEGEARNVVVLTTEKDVPPGSPVS